MVSKYLAKGTFRQINRDLSLYGLWQNLEDFGKLKSKLGKLR